ncbi:basic proline-rich protein-like [Balaenoptera ricei]|uniref:basic proline-rich protein-like n=1 Tax=Balaenoptera ricei TaxID=2746895 RepID=UPI0028BD7F81|nr:basic proline-rich protein-like [Balaenoptera ricei]
MSKPSWSHGARSRLPTAAGLRIPGPRGLKVDPAGAAEPLEDVAEQQQMKTSFLPVQLRPTPPRARPAPPRLPPGLRPQGARSRHVLFRAPGPASRQAGPSGSRGARLPLPRRGRAVGQRHQLLPFALLPRRGKRERRKPGTWMQAGGALADPPPPGPVDGGSPGHADPLARLAAWATVAAVPPRAGSPGRAVPPRGTCGARTRRLRTPWEAPFPRPRPPPRLKAPGPGEVARRRPPARHARGALRARAPPRGPGAPGSAGIVRSSRPAGAARPRLPPCLSSHSLGYSQYPRSQDSEEKPCSLN